MTPDLNRTVCDVPIFYATTEGQTRKVAERMARVLCETGIRSRAFDVAASDASSIDWSRVRGVAVGASLHAGRHQRAARRFVEAHVADLNAHPSLFFSLSLSAASANLDEVREAQRIADRFAAERGWMPLGVASIAGCLAYTKYGFLKRWVMKWIAKREGAPTDTSRDYELTNWMRVDALARELAGRLTKAAA